MTEHNEQYIPVSWLRAGDKVYIRQGDNVIGRITVPRVGGLSLGAGLRAYPVSDDV